MSSIPARDQKAVAVGPGISTVTVTPAPASSARSAVANDWMNDLLAS
ncbi:MAG: hypothetical protein V9E83_13975 [Baekduia sp.]